MVVVARERDRRERTGRAVLADRDARDRRLLRVGEVGGLLRHHGVVDERRRRRAELVLVGECARLQVIHASRAAAGSRDPQLAAVVLDPRRTPRARCGALDDDLARARCEVAGIDRACLGGADEEGLAVYLDALGRERRSGRGIFSGNEPCASAAGAVSEHERYECSHELSHVHPYRSCPCLSSTYPFPGSAVSITRTLTRAPVPRRHRDPGEPGEERSREL